MSIEQSRPKRLISSVWLFPPFHTFTALIWFGTLSFYIILTPNILQNKTLGVPITRVLLHLFFFESTSGTCNISFGLRPLKWLRRIWPPRSLWLRLNEYEIIPLDHNGHFDFCRGISLQIGLFSDILAYVTPWNLR